MEHEESDMKVVITLFSSQRSELMTYVRESSEMWDSLRNAVRITSRYLPLEETGYAIFCDFLQAQALLLTAMRHCPDAVDAIKSAIIAAQALLQ
jgi:hypothetical protein